MAFGGNFAQLVDRKPNGIILSATQIEKYATCKRKWAFEYIAGIRPPPGPGAELGTLVHAILEAWLMYGTPPDTRTKAGKIAAKMIVNLPMPGTGVTERQGWFVTRNGFAYTFKIDWSGIFYDWATVVDHKTTSNLKFAKTDAGLHCDVQALTYTIAGCHGFEVDDVQLLWNYGTTKDRDPVIQPVRTRIRLPIAEEKFERVIEPIAAEMVAARTARFDPHSFPPNAHACDDFGGCPHRAICNLSPHERVHALMNEQQPTLAARLSTMPAGGGGFMPPSGAPPVGFATPPGQGFAPPQQQQPQPQYQQPQQPQYQQPQQPQYQQPPNGAPQGGFAPPNGAGFAPPNGAGFAPPQQAGFAPPQQQQPGYTTPPNAPEAGTAPMPPQGQPQVQAAPAEPKRGRGRPKKNADETQDVAPVVNMAMQAYLAGVAGMMSNPQWNGQLDQLIWGGDVAVQAFHARFG